MIVNTPITRASVVLVIALIAVGLVLGADLGDSELLNPRSSEIEQAWSEEDIRHQEALNRLNEQQRMTEIELAQEHQRTKYAAELEAQENQAKLQATFWVIRQSILTLALVASILALGVGGAVALGRFSQRWLLTRQQSVDVLKSPVYQALKGIARTNEILMRRLELLAQPSPHPITYGGNGPHSESSRVVAHNQQKTS